jgi:DNA-binding transcriptional LysR family regulator
MGRLADSQLGARFLGLNPWVLVASPGYLAARGTPANPEDIARHAALVYSTAQGDDRWHFTGGRGGSRTVSVPLAGPLRSNNLSTLLAAARDGLGLAALPWYVAHESVRLGAVVPLLPQWSLPAQEMHAVFPSPRHVPEKVRQFAAFLAQRLDGQWWQSA